MKILRKRIDVSHCTEGVYLRWFFNGWHYFNFIDRYEMAMDTRSMDFQTTNFFSVISKTERDSRIDSEYTYVITVGATDSYNISGFTGLLMAEMVEQYEGGIWREVDVERAETVIQEEGTNGYAFTFKISRREIPGSSSVFQKSLRFFIGDTLCDLDESEIIPINKQVNDIAEMKDRQSDFSASFKIQKTRRMRELFELSGDPRSNTTFPYILKRCKLVQDNIEIVTDGIVVINSASDQYYNVSILSGNLNFFKMIETLKLTDLTGLIGDFVWDIDTMAATHDMTSPFQCVIFPLLEPSDDGGMTPMTDDGSSVSLYGGWIWPFVNVGCLFDAIIENAGFRVIDSPVLDTELFRMIYMPIQSLKVTNTDKYLYSVYWIGTYTAPNNARLGFAGATLIKGDEMFRIGSYNVPYTAEYTIKVRVSISGGGVTLGAYVNGGYFGDMTVVFWNMFYIDYEIIIPMSAGSHVEILTSGPTVYFLYWTQVTEIKDARLDYGSTIEGVENYLPDMNQTDLIKMVCHLFGLVIDVCPRDRTIRFWNYLKLYDNIPIARDWSKYLSERDDEVAFTFGSYSKNNNLVYAESDDVIKNKGKGAMQLDDENLPEENDMVELGISTTDEVEILSDTPVYCSRIAMNKWDAQDAEYKAEEEIDPRIVFVDKTENDEEFTIWDTPAMDNNSETITEPYYARSAPISFSYLVGNYAGLSRLLTKTQVRKCKMNLPVYEVAGLKHDVPVFLSQHNAYYYVNKISNYVAGKLCTVELIKM